MGEILEHRRNTDAFEDILATTPEDECSESTQLYVTETRVLVKPATVENSIPCELLNKDSRVRLEWRGVCVNTIPTRDGLCARLCKRTGHACDTSQESVQILRNVDGVAHPGSLLGIMGASGSGKSTLLNVLSRQNCRGIEIKGSISVNGVAIKKRTRQHMSAYVQQEDLFIGTLTVKEHLTFQASLRMDSKYTPQQKIQRVNDVIEQFGLAKCRDTIIGVPGRVPGISGGEKKRLSFASEVITDPKLLFVDEPTSGLDSYMAENCILELQRLANEGRTVIASIHQPSSSVFQLFDSLMLLSEGRTAFHGTREDAFEFFNQCGHPCPTNFNPADHYIRTLSIVPGCEENSRETCEGICNTYTSLKYAVQKAETMDADADNDEIVTAGDNVATARQGFCTQTRAILWRATKQFIREPLVSNIKLIQGILISLVIGLIFLQQPNNQDGIRNINGAIFFLIIILSFANALSIIMVFPWELPVFLRENKLNMYGIGAYFIGRQLAELPWYALVTSVQVTIIYWMTGLSTDFTKFLVFLGIAHLTAQCGLSYGMVISALAPTPNVAQALGGPSMLPLFIFGGYFIKVDSIPVYFVWLRVFSWMRYSFELSLVNQWEGHGDISCANSTAGCLYDGDAVLEKTGFAPGNFNASIGCLLALIIGFRVVAFLMLLLRSRRSK